MTAWDDLARSRGTPHAASTQPVRAGGGRCDAGEGGDAMTTRLAGSAGDPGIRTDGRCVQCNRRRHPESSRRYAGVLAEFDPFCSTDCCRLWHHVVRDTDGKGISGSGGLVSGTPKRYL